MAFRLPQRMTLVATGLLTLVTASDFSPATKADDPAAAQPAHEAAVLDRIFANWKTRHDRVRALHLTWDCRMTCKKGSIDFLSPLRPRPRFERDQPLDQFGGQLWIDGDDRVCRIETPFFEAPQAKLTDTGRIVHRAVFTEKTTSTLTDGPLYVTGTSPVRAHSPRGALFPALTGERWTADPPLQAPLLTFRPQQRSLLWRREQCHVVDENCVVDDCRCIKLQRVIETSPTNPMRREESCWVNPARDNAVIHWVIHTPSYHWEGSIRHKKHETYGWVPAEWSFELPDSRWEYKVTNCAFNERTDPVVFSQEFPAGTAVYDGMSHPARYYSVQQDGSKRVTSLEEFHRLVDDPVAAKRRAAVKP